MKKLRPGAGHYAAVAPQCAVVAAGPPPENALHGMAVLCLSHPCIRSALAIGWWVDCQKQFTGSRHSRGGMDHAAAQGGMPTRAFHPLPGNASFASAGGFRERDV